MEAVDADYAEELRENALALATHGPPVNRANAMADEELAQAKGLLERAETVSGIGPEYAEGLREQAWDVVAETVADALVSDAERVVVDRDVKATVESIDDMTPKQVGWDE